MRDHGHEAARKERLRVFLCHASDDKPQVREIYRRLSDSGFQPWLDEEDLLVGQQWEHEIEKAVRTSHVVIVCLSPNSVSKAGYVQKEILVALEVAERQPEGTNFILPVRLEQCEIPQRLNTKHCANLFEAGGYSRLTKALRAYARDRGLFTPGPEDDAHEVSWAKAPSASPAPQPPAPVPVRPRPSPRLVRTRAEGKRSHKKAGSRILTLSGAAVLLGALAIIIGLSFKNCGGGAVPADDSIVRHLVENKKEHPVPVLPPEPRTEKTPEPPPPTPAPTPAPAKPQAEAGPDENKNDAPPAGSVETTARTRRPSLTLSRYRIDIFLTRDTKSQRGFAEEIGRHLRPHVREVTFPKGPFKAVTGCQALYLYGGKDDPLNEDAAADALVKQLNGAYPNASFQKTAVADKTTPNIMTLVIGSSCRK